MMVEPEEVLLQEVENRQEQRAELRAGRRSRTGQPINPCLAMLDNLLCFKILSICWPTYQYAGQPISLLAELSNIELHVLCWPTKSVHDKDEAT